MVFLVTFHGYSLPSHSVLSASLLLPLSLPLRSPPVLLSSCCNACRGRRAGSPATPCLPSARHLYLPHIVYGIFHSSLPHSADCRTHSLLSARYPALLYCPLPAAVHIPYWLHDIPLFFTASSDSRTHSLLAARYPALLRRPLPAATCLLHRLRVILPLLHSPYR